MVKAHVLDTRFVDTYGVACYRLKRRNEVRAVDAFEGGPLHAIYYEISKSMRWLPSPVQ